MIHPTRVMEALLGQSTGTPARLEGRRFVATPEWTQRVSDFFLADEGVRAPIRGDARFLTRAGTKTAMALFAIA